MANNKLTEGVGKKIVEALKKQSEIEITPISANEELQDDLNDLLDENMNDFTVDEETIFDEPVISEEFIIDEPVSEPVFVQSQPVMEEIPFTPVFQQPMMNETFSPEPENFEIPSNIAVLKKLISQLPSGVTRHTGAQIIRQTMEALGISMKSVLQEAQQIQDGLNNSAKECQSTIAEYKRQIASLEKQSQSYQKQYTTLNELISLFIQTGH